MPVFICEAIWQLLTVGGKHKNESRFQENSYFGFGLIYFVTRMD